MTRGLIVGKFYPPHAGHHYLIDQALGQCDQLNVLVWWSKTESFSGEKRWQILTEMHPRATVWEQQCEIEPDYGNDDVWRKHVNLLNHMGWFKGDFEYVFSSEEYGDELADRLGAAHICVDPDRINMPISGTEVRENPYENWQWLAEPTRAALTRRIVIIGAESTGTTTLAKSLAKHYGTVWVPEYGRLYTEGTGALNHEWGTDEFLHIAQFQEWMEDAMARKAGPVMFCDTDPLATSIWHERYRWFTTPELEYTARLAKRNALYIQTSQEGVAFENDGTRDGEGKPRDWMDKRIWQVLNDLDLPRIKVYGNHENRMAQAIDAIGGKAEIKFSNPLGA